jgi:hypothetical protein
VGDLVRRKESSLQLKKTLEDPEKKGYNHVERKALVKARINGGVDFAAAARDQDSR